MDAALGRIRVSVPQEELTKALRADVLHRFVASGQRSQQMGSGLHQDWIQLLNEEAASSWKFGVLARKLVEMQLNWYAIPKADLASRIRALESKGRVPPWICGYMHVLRHLGNDAAHASTGQAAGGSHAVTPSDLVAGLHCVQRILEQWVTDAAAS